MSFSLANLNIFKSIDQIKSITLIEGKEAKLEEGENFNE
jgi:hypothetical protein